MKPAEAVFPSMAMCRLSKYTLPFLGLNVPFAAVFLKVGFSFSYLAIIMRSLLIAFVPVTVNSWLPL